jgi:hypothetical protein
VVLRWLFVVLSLNVKFQEFPLILAQGQIFPENPNPPVASETIALSDQTRLGPYSVLLKDAFEASRAAQTLQLNESETALDLVAMGRSLTPEEKNQGLQQQLVTREKIALIIDADNPFQGTLTLEQVTQIFKGEITNWQQVGGDDRPLKLVNRPRENQTRQALGGYPLFSQAQWDANALQSAEDTTAEIVAALGTNGIGYAPASEAIEQFNLRIVTIDNVGVDDSRYPFSQPLYYAYSQQPPDQVQGFLDFLGTPDAQSAIEFAQSQPADPTRPFVQPSLGGLTKSAIAPSNPPQTAVQPDLIPAAPLDPVAPLDPASSPQPTASQAPATAINPPTSRVSGDPWSWLPLLLIFAGLGILGWLTFMRVQLAKKRKQVPRPAPNYAERLKVQGSNRDMNDLKALVRHPRTQGNDEPVQAPPPAVVPDLSLAKFNDEPSFEDDLFSDDSSRDSKASEPTLSDSSSLWGDDPSTLEAPPISAPETDLEIDEDLTTLQPRIDEASFSLEENTPSFDDDWPSDTFTDSGESEPAFFDSASLWDNDQTTLQSAPIPNPEPDLGIDDNLIPLQSRMEEPTVSFDDLDSGDLSENPPVDLDWEDPTTLQGTSLDSSTTERPNVPLDPISLEDTDQTLLQGVSLANVIEPEDANDEIEDQTDPTVIQGFIPLDPLTGREIGEDFVATDEAGVTEDELVPDESENSDPQKSRWNIADPWE